MDHKFTFKNITVTSPCGGATIAICDGIKGGVGDDMSCYPSDSKEGKAALADTGVRYQATLTAKPWG